MNQSVRIGRGKDLYFFNQISRRRRQTCRASVSRAREIQSREVITNKAFFHHPMGGCWGVVAAVALMLKRWGRARAMCPMSEPAKGEGSLRGVRTLRCSWGVVPAVALLQGGGWWWSSLGGVLRSDTVEALRVADLISRAHQKKHFIDWHAGT